MIETWKADRQNLTERWATYEFHCCHVLSRLKDLRAYRDAALCQQGLQSLDHNLCLSKL